MDNGIVIDQVSKKFGVHQVLNDISHVFEGGKVHGIVGNNGSGKTVLMKCICGFLTPDKGTITVSGKRVGIDIDFPDDLGIIIETPGFLPNSTGFKNLSILASLRGKIDKDKIRETIERVGLDPDLKKGVSKYSLGMRQKLGIAQVIMEDPSLMVLDEPFNGLDKQSSAKIRDLIKELCNEGKTIILASHNQYDIDSLCETVVEMDAGELSIIRA